MRSRFAKVAGLCLALTAWASTRLAAEVLDPYTALIGLASDNGHTAYSCVFNLMDLATPILRIGCSDVARQALEEAIEQARHAKRMFVIDRSFENEISSEVWDPYVRPEDVMAAVSVSNIKVSLSHDTRALHRSIFELKRRKRWFLPERYSFFTKMGPKSKK